METMGVSGFWGVRQIEQAGLTTAKTSLLLMIASVAFYYLLFVVFLGGISDRSTTQVAVFFGILNGLVLSATLALARWTQADLEGLIPVAPEIEPSVGLLRPDRKLVLWCFALELIAWGWLFYLGRFGLAPVSVASVLRFWATPRGFFLGILLPFTLAVIWTLGLAVIIRQARALTYAARHIEIDVLELEHYPRLATPLARFVVFTLVLVSVAPTASLLPGSGTPDAMVLFGMPVLVLGTAMLVATYAYPVLILRSRIRDAKGHELDCVLSSLRGDAQAMAKSRIGARAQSLSLSELLDYRSFIESLWEWPVAPHLHRIILFGLLPPMTWVLTALIENAVSAVLGSG